MKYLATFFLSGLTVIFVLLTTAFLLSLLNLYPFSSHRTLTITGVATQKQPNKVARFSVSVVFTGKDKKEVLDNLNQTVSKIIDTAKSFGVNPADIKTQSVSFHKKIESNYNESGPQKNQTDQWEARNTVEIILRDTQRAENFVNALNQAGATSVYGPEFMNSSEEKLKTQQQLLIKAIDNARNKAEQIARQNHFKIIRILSINTDVSNRFPPIYRTENVMRGSSPYVPGQTSYSKAVKVIFEIK